ncbi:hypothetical protein EF847_14550 [Actinobacteria bacterium YIM 96077]|uniref:Thioredoxin domain-containing protein n=1 Tax=Phytoactinopolyspora halophila TaxID=1981511 RepID=A0A329QAW8_9ACTN|nr:hypothetical protein EF847_14550 [Actinobacteria bacterium YIM 96077]RAW09464.1 hypothetical protein DPM12_21020 [Phytoactinopolyspora halophila]
MLAACGSDDAVESADMEGSDEVSGEAGSEPEGEVDDSAEDAEAGEDEETGERDEPEDGAESGGDEAAGGGESAETDAEDAPVPEQLEFTATTVDGESFDGATLAGQPSVFWFWAPWCSSCMAEAPHVLDVAEEHEGELNVVGVASLGGEPEMRDFIERTNTEDLPHLADEDGEIWILFEIAEQSTFALVDADGEVTHRGPLSPEDLSAQAAELAS